MKVRLHLTLPFSGIQHRWYDLQDQKRKYTSRMLQPDEKLPDGSEYWLSIEYVPELVKSVLLNFPSGTVWRMWLEDGTEVPVCLFA